MIKEYSGITVNMADADADKTNLIYLILFPNGKAYIGQTKQKLATRIRHHCSPSQTGCSKLKRAMSKYRSFDVSVLSSNLSIEQMNVYEQFFIKTFDSVKCGYNLDSGGKNKLLSQETKDKISKANKGKKISEAHKKAISIAQKNKEVSLETRLKQSKSHKNDNSHKAKRVISKPDLIIFDTCKEAEEYYAIGNGKLFRYYNGNYHKKSGQTFTFIDEVKNGD